MKENLAGSVCAYLGTAAIFVFLSAWNSAAATTCPDIVDLARGEALFVKCKICHSLERDDHRIGPSLYRVFGRRIGGVNGFDYSDAMGDYIRDNFDPNDLWQEAMRAVVTWNMETLDAYVRYPDGFISDNRMPFPGLGVEGEPSAASIADVCSLLLYIKANSGVQEYTRLILLVLDDKAGPVSMEVLGTFQDPRQCAEHKREMEAAATTHGTSWQGRFFCVPHITESAE